MSQKKISIVVPCYNEENSIHELRDRVTKVFQNDLPQYDYDIIYVDDYSSDQTRDRIKEVCGQDRKCKAVFNARNFGFHRNVFQSFQYGDGDAVFMMFGDLQDPPEMLPEFVKKWEGGYKCIVGQRTADKDNLFMKFMRRCYYRMIDLFSKTSHLKNMDGYGLYDRFFVDILAQIEETSPYLKATIEEYGIGLCSIYYKQEATFRKKSNFNFWRNYDFAMHGLTSSTKFLMRLATFFGMVLGILSIIYAIYVLIRKLIDWDRFPAGTASIMVAVTLIGAALLFFVGIMGEYILSINERSAKKPRVVVGQKINFEDVSKEDSSLK